MVRPIPFSSLAPSARDLMHDIGPVWGRDIQKHRDLVFDAYGPLLERAPRHGVVVDRDIAYGPHARQVVDVFRPVEASGAPVVMFVHGGAFVRGAKDATPQVYSNVLYWFARQGCVGVNVEYRLAPEAVYPAGAHDVGAAVAWVRANIGRWNGDPGQVFLVGHSAGGTHVASWAYDPAARPDGPLPVRGLALLSARLRADNRPDNPNAGGVRAYFGADESLYEARSPVTHAVGHPTPVFVGIAQYENPLLDVYGAEFFHRVSVARGCSPRIVRLAGHNHISSVAHFNSGEDRYGLEILEFMDSVLAGRE